MGAAVLRCSPHCCHQLGPDCEEEALGLVGFESLSVLDWGQGLANGEPVGRALPETLLSGSSLDRDLMCFAASPALAVVRWLVHLGGKAELSDPNGTTALHAACRAGSLAVVKQFIKHSTLLNKPDVAGWTPLHIAAHMGRRAVVVRLLQARAAPQLVNSRGLRAPDLCKDTVTYQAILRSLGPEEVDQRQGALAQQLLMESTGLTCEDEEDDLDQVGLPQQCEPELFFVNPRPVFTHTAPHRKVLLGLAAAVFNLRPSHGLAIMVLTGLEEGYTTAMKVLLKQGNVSRASAGSFLGEPLSVCPLIRFSFFDSLPLLNTGCISCMRTVFSALGIPEELQKLDQLLWAVASVWWRKHRALHESGRVPLKRGNKAVGSELTGLELWQYLSCQEVLYQLMLSSLLLHRRLWGGSSMAIGPMDFQDWCELNQGLERQGEDDVPQHVQKRIYNDVVSMRVPEFFRPQVAPTVADVPEEVLPGPTGPLAYVADTVRKAITYSEEESALQHRASLEGWLWVHTSALLPGSLGSSECANHTTQVEEERLDNENPHRIWASLCGMCLAFSSRAPGCAVPHCVMDCRGLQFQDVSDEAKSLVLAPAEAKRGDRGDLLRAAKLLPDGRWEELLLPKLKMSFESSEVLDLWVLELAQKPCEASLPARLKGMVSTELLSSVPEPKDVPMFSQDEMEELQEVSFVGNL